MCVVKQAKVVTGFCDVRKGGHDWQDMLAKDDTDTITGSDDGC